MKQKDNAESGESDATCGGCHNSASRNIIEYCSYPFGLTAAAVLFCMMAITFADVLGRYFFATPLLGAFEVTELCLAVMVFSALPLVTLRSEHVTTALFDHLISGGMRKFQILSCELLSMAGSIGIAWCCWVQADQASVLAESTQVLKIAKSSFIYFVSIAATASAIAHMITAYKRVWGNH